MWCLICPSCFDCGNHLLRICWLFLSNGIWTWMISNPHAIFSNVKHLLCRPTCTESVWAIWLDLTKRSLGSCSVGGFARRSTWSSGLSPLIELASFVFLACVLLMKAIGNFNNSKVSSKRLRVDYSIVLIKLFPIETIETPTCFVATRYQGVLEQAWWEKCFDGFHLYDPAFHRDQMRSECFL